MGWWNNSYLLHPQQCYLGNKYHLMHTFIASKLVGCIMAWFSLFAICCASSKGLYKTSLLQMWVSWDECISWEYIKSCKWSINHKYVNLAIILHIFSSTKSHVQYWWNCKFSPFFWYPLFVILVAFFNAFQISLVPLVIVVMYLECLCLKFTQYTIR